MRQIKPSPTSPEFEIHFAAEVADRAVELRRELSALDFEHDPLAFAGVVYPEELSRTHACCPILDTHVTWSTYDRSDYFRKLEDFSRLLDGFGGDIEGYAHAEIVRPEWDVDFKWAPFDPSAALDLMPFRLEANRGAKLWDVHISARLETLDARMMTLLHEEMNFYFIDLNKRSGPHRIFTIQGSEGIRSARAMFAHLTTGLSALGGFEGSAKFEQTIYWRVLGEPDLLPPRLEGTASDYYSPSPQPGSSAISR